MTAVTTMTSAAVMAASTAMTAVAMGVAAVATVTAVTMGVAAVATVTTMADKFYERRCSVAFLVEDVECRQADIPDFFLTEEDLIAISVA
jgi:hypothetical protein